MIKLIQYSVSMTVCIGCEMWTGFLHHFFDVPKCHENGFFSRMLISAESLPVKL
jgi:hypothetical protein